MYNNKTALVLSGGGSRGAYEVGVWKALDELGIEIDLVTGTSVGAINGAMVAQNKLDLAISLWKELTTDMVFDLEGDDALSYAKEILTKGGASTDGLKNILSQYIDEDLVRGSKTDFGLVTVELPFLKARHLMLDDIDDGKLIPYIMASAACFPATQQQSIDGIKFIDGGYHDNLPTQLAIDNGAKRVIAVDLHAVGIENRKNFKDIEDLTLIEAKWDLGNFLVFDKTNSANIIDLGYLATMKALGRYDGIKYTFEKGEFSIMKMRGADEAGVIFELNPRVVYTNDLFNEKLKEAVDTFEKESDTEKEFAELNNEIEIIMKKGLTLNEIKKLPGALPEIKKIISDSMNLKGLVIYIAESLKQNQTKSNLFLSKSVMKILHNEILAANYLLKTGII